MPTDIVQQATSNIGSKENPVALPEVEVNPNTSLEAQLAREVIKYKYEGSTDSPNWASQRALDKVANTKLKLSNYGWFERLLSNVPDDMEISGQANMHGVTFSPNDIYDAAAITHELDHLYQLNNGIFGGDDSTDRIGKYAKEHDLENVLSPAERFLGSGVSDETRKSVKEWAKYFADPLELQARMSEQDTEYALNKSMMSPAKASVYGLSTRFNAETIEDLRALGAPKKRKGNYSNAKITELANRINNRVDDYEVPSYADGKPEGRSIIRDFLMMPFGGGEETPQEPTAEEQVRLAEEQMYQDRIDRTGTITQGGPDTWSQRLDQIARKFDYGNPIHQSLTGLAKELRGEGFGAGLLRAFGIPLMAAAFATNPIQMALSIGAGKLVDKAAGGDFGRWVQDKIGLDRQTASLLNPGYLAGGLTRGVGEMSRIFPEFFKPMSVTRSYRQRAYEDLLKDPRKQYEALNNYRYKDVKEMMKFRKDAELGDVPFTSKERAKINLELKRTSTTTDRFKPKFGLSYALAKIANEKLFPGNYKLSDSWVEGSNKISEVLSSILPLRNPDYRSQRSIMNEFKRALKADVKDPHSLTGADSQLRLDQLKQGDPITTSELEYLTRNLDPSYQKFWLSSAIKHNKNIRYWERSPILHPQFFKQRADVHDMYTGIKSTPQPSGIRIHQEATPNNPLYTYTQERINPSALTIQQLVDDLHPTKNPNLHKSIFASIKDLQPGETTRIPAEYGTFLDTSFGIGRNYEPYVGRTDAGKYFSFQKDTWDINPVSYNPRWDLGTVFGWGEPATFKHMLDKPEFSKLEEFISIPKEYLIK
jgi:hypothetical protein